jgi:LmbE family N-acetylglucosaminyl deacetylase
MKLHKPTVDLFVPDGIDLASALTRTTHLGIGAHQDDLEIMAFQGVAACHGRRDQWFTGITCTDGAGSARAGVYAEYSDADMTRVRHVEQRSAASVGGYAAMIQLDYSSKESKNPANTELVHDLRQILEATQPETVYTHNPADKHPTHVAIFAATLKAIRSLPLTARPKRLLGCEVWRGLDWMDDKEKSALDVTGHENLGMALTALFDSQVAGGKRYDLATLGRRRANATYFEAHGVDQAQELIFAMDLTPLIANDTRNVADFVTEYIRHFEADVKSKLALYFPGE